MKRAMSFLLFCAKFLASPTRSTLYSTVVAGVAVAAGAAAVGGATVAGRAVADAGKDVGRGAKHAIASVSQLYG